MNDQASFFVMERTPRWKDFLVKELMTTTEESILRKVVSVDSFRKIFEAFRSFPSSFLITELTFDQYREFISLAVRLKSDFPRARIAVYSPELLGFPPTEYRESVLLLNQAGCLAVLSSLAELSGLVPVIVRHFQLLSPSSRSITSRIRENLPQF